MKQDSAPRKAPVFDEMNVVYPDTAGVDIGSASHYASVPEDRDPQPVREFGCFTPDLHAMAAWLKECRIRHVVMESTGVFWVPLYQILEQEGFVVSLVDARQARNVPGRKSDVSDCQWLRKLYTFGLLRGCFIPPAEVGVLRSYWRHRCTLVESCAQQIHRMQKALEQMNVQLHKVLSDITGVSGMRILRAIVGGERDAMRLAGMKHALVKASDEQIIKALTGNYRPEHIFSLRQALEAYDFLQNQIADCDLQIQVCMQKMPDRRDPDDPPKRCDKRKGTPRRKNEPYFDLQGELVRAIGIDLSHIDGLSSLTVQTVISECGPDLCAAFKTEKHFASWLGLSPNNRITGGRIKSRRTKKTQSRVANALRVAAQSLHHSRSALGAFYRRMMIRHGAPKAITATAHRLATLIYRMLKYGQAYVDQGQEAYEKQYQQRLFQTLQRQARTMGFVLMSAESGELVS